ncbi:YcgL domain-containing protein [Thalassotalea euphylliae]|uniref:YcgL domain-containing protein DXX94_18025 n=1 Tax=Thalassotalea euphylliae TaxID=1655234 RepID=A0A3E0U6Q1_9GAMM|nr:YcgL domain-containing protein [Thalassotalea euphylliae]REL32460.1 YcgL domain-containing protein [Thalassotalea euphylliae]
MPSAPTGLCAVYRSPKKDQTYLFVNKRDDFSDVPEALMKTFGTPVLVTMVNLTKQEKLALADIDKVKESLSEQGFYLQLPPPQENLLDQHKEMLKQQGKTIASEE